MTETDKAQHELVALRDEDVYARDGLSVVLTIDSAVQHIVETALADALAEAHAQEHHRHCHAAAHGRNPGPGLAAELRSEPAQHHFAGNAEPGHHGCDGARLDLQNCRATSKPIANPYPFNFAAARTLLSAHGWTLVNNVLTCTSPGTGATECGANIAQGYQLSFNVVWPSGTTTLDQTMTAEIANWQSLGIQITHTTDTFNNVISDCTGAKPFEICAWGYGWSYVPSDYPSGESLFLPGGDFNVGTYANAQMTALIKKSIYGTSNLSAYVSFAAQQLPVLYQPQANSIDEVARVLKSSIGFTPNPLGDFTPEYFHY